MLDLFVVPQINLPEPSLVHRIYDTEDYIKRKGYDKSTELYQKMLERKREQYRKQRDLHPTP